jgi:hypothetical protein
MITFLSGWANFVVYERPALTFQIGKCEGTLNLSEPDLVHDLMHEVNGVKTITRWKIGRMGGSIKSWIAMLYSNLERCFLCLQSEDFGNIHDTQRKTEYTEDILDLPLNVRGIEFEKG